MSPSAVWARWTGAGSTPRCAVHSPGKELTVKYPKTWLLDLAIVVIFLGAVVVVIAAATG